MAIIDSGLEAVEMRNRMDSKGALEVKGSLYVGTGGTTTVTRSDDSTVAIPETTAFNPPNTTDANGGVMIWDTSVNSDTGWAVAKIKTKNLENGRVEQANKAKRADTILSNGEYKSFADAFVQECLLKIYPIGSIYMSVNDVSPQKFLGGKWEAWGQGKVPVGVNPSDTDFKDAGKTGGEKKHLLDQSEMPEHTHRYCIYNRVSEGNAYALHLPTEQGAWSHNVAKGTDAYSLQPEARVEPGANSGYFNILKTGGSGAHNNLQPYITCYMWKRTA